MDAVFVRFVVSTVGGGSGAKCEDGFLDLAPSQLRTKQNTELRTAAEGRVPWPAVDDLRVSVFYDSVKAEDAWMLGSTLPSVIQHFPRAWEVVIVVHDELASSAYEDMARSYENIAPFPLRVVLVTHGNWTPSTSAVSYALTERVSPSVLLSSLWADKYCSGNFALHLNTESLLIKRVTYQTFFHLGKPVIPFARLEAEGERQNSHAHSSPPSIFACVSAQTRFVEWS